MWQSIHVSTYLANLNNAKLTVAFLSTLSMYAEKLKNSTLLITSEQVHF